MRLKKLDSMVEVVSKMSEDSVTARAVVAFLMLKRDKNGNPFGGCRTVALLDGHGIYGARIYKLYELCGKDSDKMVTLLGTNDSAYLNRAIDSDLL